MFNDCSLFETENEFVCLKGKDVGLPFDIHFDSLGFKRYEKDKEVILQAIGNASDNIEAIKQVAYFEMKMGNVILPFVLHINEETYDTKDAYFNNEIYNNFPNVSMYSILCLDYINEIWPIIYMYYNGDIESYDLTAFCKRFYEKFTEFKQQEIAMNINGFKLNRENNDNNSND